MLPMLLYKYTYFITYINIYITNTDIHIIKHFRIITLGTIFCTLRLLSNNGCKLKQKSLFCIKIEKCIKIRQF